MFVNCFNSAGTAVATDEDVQSDAELISSVAEGIEACICDLHSFVKNSKDYYAKTRTLISNLKRNEVCTCNGLLPQYIDTRLTLSVRRKCELC